MKVLASVLFVPFVVLGCGGGGTSTGGSPATSPSPKPATFDMSAVGDSGVTGTVEVLKQTGSFMVTLKLKGMSPGSSHAAHIHLGKCGSNGKIVFPLSAVNADGTGKAQASSTVSSEYTVPPEGWYANVHTGPDLTQPGQAKPVSCGELS
jgi:CHRD domain